MWHLVCGVASRRSVTMVEPEGLPAPYQPQRIELQRQLAA